VAIGATTPAKRFDAWLNHAAARPGAARVAELERWQDVASAKICHPRPDDLLPLTVAAGWAELPGQRAFNESVLETMISGIRFE
jgi:hypothetical protein